jgi:FdrA protein
MGAEEFVEGRAHPMMDFGLRNLRILQEARDPETAVILIDVELGYGSNADPAGQLVPVIEKAKRLAEEAGRNLPFVASVIGTEGDFQGLARQEKALSDAGMVILPSNAQATRITALIASERSIEGKIRERSN